MEKTFEDFIVKKRATWLRFARIWCHDIISKDEAEDVVQEIIYFLLKQTQKNDKFINMMNRPKNNQTELDYYVIKIIRNNCQSPGAPYYQKYHKHSALEKVVDIPQECLIDDSWKNFFKQNEMTPEEKVQIIRAIFDSMNFSEYNRKIFIFHYFEYRSLKEWEGPESYRKLSKICYEMKKLLTKKIKKLEEEGGDF